ncbi:hypothetical protein AAC387_Pa01g3498 [Persea americana]
MPESENVTPNVSAPATPGTLGAPLFSSIPVDSLSYDRKSMPRCNKCFSVESFVSSPTCLIDFPKPDVSLTRKLGAEFVGTFILIFFATAAPIVNQKYNGAETLIGNAGCAGLAVPAYITAQVSASVCASFALKAVFHPFLSGGVTVPSISILQAFMLEFIISFNLMFVVTAVATDSRAVGELAGIAVGATVMLNILIAGPGTGGSMNPVRTLGPAIAAGNYDSVWIYLIAPILGAVTGAAVYTTVKLRDEVDAPPRRSFRR